MDGLGKAWSRMEGVGSMVADMQRAGWSQEDGIMQINEISLPCWVSFHLFFCFWRQVLRSFIHNLPKDPPISKGPPPTTTFLGSPKADRKFYMHPSLFFRQVKISLSLSPAFLAHSLCKGYFFPAGSDIFGMMEWQSPQITDCQSFWVPLQSCPPPFLGCLYPLSPFLPTLLFIRI